MVKPFEPSGGSGGTLSIIVGTSAQSVVIPKISPDSGSVRLVVIGSETVFISFEGDAEVDGSLPLPGPSVEVFSIPRGATAVSAIAENIGSTLYVTAGVGV